MHTCVSRTVLLQKASLFGFLQPCAEHATLYYMMNHIVFPVNRSLSTWIVVRDADNTDTNRTALHLKHFAIITQDQFLKTGFPDRLILLQSAEQ